jgi:hypothetical protein
VTRARSCAPTFLAARTGPEASDERGDHAGPSHLRVELERILERPTRAELAQRIAEREPVELEPSAAELIREERERR